MIQHRECGVCLKYRADPEDTEGAGSDHGAYRRVECMTAAAQDARWDLIQIADRLEDFAIMAMVKRGMGVGILPDVILRRIPYRLEVRPLKEPYYRSIGLAMKHAAHLTPAARKFIDYLLFREADRS